MESEIFMDTVFTGKEIREAIHLSHQRSKTYNISPHRRDPNQVKLSADELRQRQEANRDLLAVVVTYIEEFYEQLSPDDFIIAFVDRDGYILNLYGSKELQALFAEGNCAPSYRWTEKDVGTTAISLCLYLQKPVILNSTDHYCTQAHRFTSSAAPIFGPKKELQGVFVVSGNADLVHPHTLLMVSSVAGMFEKHMRVVRRTNEMAFYIGFLDSMIEAAGTGVLTVDKDARVWKTNRKGKQILRRNDLEGKPVSTLKGLDIDLDDIYKNPDSWKTRECVITNNNEELQLLYSAQPVLSRQQELLGAVLVLEEFNDINRRVQKISGNRPFFTFDHLIGCSQPFSEAVELARRAAHSDTTVLLLGETGTGKELFTQAIHNASSRREQLLVPINCGAIPRELLESELFGYVGGAFTGSAKGGRIGKFELASEGTILLDEIGDMPHDMQVKLLRVLQTGEIQRVGSNKIRHTRARIIASTHVNLPSAVKENRFRQDLYYRLNIVEIHIPPLRERGAGDIELLANHFLKSYGSQSCLSDKALEALCSCNWPGNVRELENTIQRALHNCQDRTVQPNHLRLPKSTLQHSQTRYGTLREMEKEMIEKAMTSTGANIARTARELGISRATLYRKLKEYGFQY